MSTYTQDHIVLDHFYVAFNIKQVQALKKLTKILGGVVHNKIKSGKDSWEGVYLRSRTGAYFEMVSITNGKNEVAGIALSARYIQYLDLRKIKNELPKLKWETFRRVHRDNTPWFDSVSIKGPENTGLSCWMMHYYFSHLSKLTKPPKKHRSNPLFSIDRFVHFKLVIGRKFVKELKEHCSWIPKKQTFTKNKITMTIPDRELSEFKVDIAIDETDLPLRFISLEMCPVREHRKISDFTLGPIQFSTLKNDNWLLKNNQIS